MVALIAIGVGAYILGLVATIPAASVVKAADPEQVSGTVWRGQAAVGNGHRVVWRWAPLRSLVSLAAAADVVVEAENTNIAGRLTLRPGTVELDKLNGLASGGLLQAAFPKLPFACETTMRVDLGRVVLGADRYRIDGKIRSEAGSCTPAANGAAVPVEAMVATFVSNDAGTTGNLAPRGQQRRHLVDGRLSRDGRLRLDVTPAGASALPFVAPGGASSLETSL